MHLLLIGISHRTAPIELRERVDFQARGVAAALADIGGRASALEAVVLSTCNRSEVYAACDDLERARTDLVDFVTGFHGVERAALVPHVYEATGLDVARHLFRVASGLDSLVIGEPQILGQVKEAHAAATTAHTAGPVLNRLFQASFGAGKRVRTETALGSGAVSVGFAAVALARKIFGELKGRSVLVIGAGEMGKLTARHMKSQGVDRITIVSRSMAHAARAAEAIGGALAAPWDELNAALGASDIVITATGAASPIVSRAQLDTVMRTRRNRPLFVIDIAVPRDVEASAGEIEQVFLYNIDDLQAAVQENLARRASEIAQAESIVIEEVDRFAAWLRSRGAIPTVVALRQRFEAIRQSELDRLDFKLASLGPEGRERVDEVTRLIVEKLLLTPTERLKGLQDADALGQYTDALTRLFNLQSSGEQADASSDAASGTSSPRRVEPFPRRRTGPR
ncbi:MAG: glutamyl-tRNA reductase [Vicinamibacterales bacterium]